MIQTGASRSACASPSHLDEATRPCVLLPAVLNSRAYVRDAWLCVRCLACQLTCRTACAMSQSAVPAGSVWRACTFTFRLACAHIHERLTCA